MIKFACPGCQASFSVGDDKAGKTGKCPKCGSQFEIPHLEVASAAAPPPPPPPPPTPTPASAFAFDDEPPVPEKPKKTKKTPSKADLDDDDDDDDKGKDDDDDDRDDDDDDDTPKNVSPGKGMAIGAAVANILMALALGACGGYNGLKGLCCGVVSDSKTQTTIKLTQAKTAEEKELRELFDPEKARKAQYVAYATGALSVLTAFVMLTASIGCFMRKPFGKYGTFVGVFFGLLSTGFMFVISLVIVGTSHMTWLDYLGGIGGGIATLLVGGFACFAVIKGIPKGGAKAPKKSDEDEEEEPEEEEEEKPAPKKKKKKVEEEDDEDEEPKPKKKKKRKDDDDDDD